jgi:hypothetical protein
MRNEKKVLYYHGSTDEVKVGDRVEVKRFLGKPMLGVVVYVPGQSPSNSDMVDESGLQDWAIELDIGRILAWPFLPGELQPNKKIRLISRGHPFTPPGKLH